MEFCPHCGRNLDGFYQYCKICGPERTWWFQDPEIVEELGLDYEQRLVTKNDGEIGPLGLDKEL